MPSPIPPRQTLLCVSILAWGVLLLSGCARDNPLAPPDDADLIQPASPPGHAQNPAEPPGWDKRGGDRGDRIRDLEDRGPAGDVPPGLVDTRYVVVDIDPAASLDDILAAAGATLVADLSPIGMAKVRATVWSTPAPTFLKKLKKTPGVLAAEFDRGVEATEARGMTVSFNDGSIRRADVDAQPFLDRIRAAEAHALSRGAGVRVAVLDTGVDPAHPGLAGRLAAGWDCIGRDDSPWDVATGIDEDGDGLVDEAFGHGTHVAGIVALLAPEAEVHVYRVLDDEGWGSASTVALAILRAVEADVDVINLSLGMYENFKALEKAVDLAVRQGIVVVASVGNDGVENPAQYPALYATVLSVGSAGFDDTLAPFSSYGRHLDVTAPGVDVLSLFPGGGYAAWSGSSMASAVASALAALVVQRHPEFTPAMVQRKIVGGVAPGTGLHGLSGYGRVDFLSTLD